MTIDDITRALYDDYTRLMADPGDAADALRSPVGRAAAALIDRLLAFHDDDLAVSECPQRGLGQPEEMNDATIREAMLLIDREDDGVVYGSTGGNVMALCWTLPDGREASLGEDGATGYGCDDDGFGWCVGIDADGSGRSHTVDLSGDGAEAWTVGDWAAAFRAAIADPDTVGPALRVGSSTYNVTAREY